MNERLEVALVDDQHPVEYCLHYNDERPHRSRNLRPPASRSDRMHMAGGQIERSTRLGGLLSDYRRMPGPRNVIFEPDSQLGCHWLSSGRRDGSWWTNPILSEAPWTAFKRF